MVCVTSRASTNTTLTRQALLSMTHIMTLCKASSHP